jgi:hypothetical protein
VRSNISKTAQARLKQDLGLQFKGYNLTLENRRTMENLVARPRRRYIKLAFARLRGKSGSLISERLETF